MTYTVAFNANGGTGGQSTTIKATPNKAMPAISTTAPTRTGYTFMGWYDNNDYTKGTQYYTSAGKSARSFNKTSAITLYAGWKANTFTVTYDSNGGTGTTESHKCTYDSTCTLSESKYKKTGYSFTGWKKDNAGSILAAKKSIKNVVTSGTVKYYAQWEVVTYTVTFNANGGTGGQSTAVTATPDKTMPAISTTSPTKEGYTFLGWYDSITGGTMYYTKEGKSARSFNKTSDTTLYARWNAITHKITFNANGGSGSVPASVTVTYGSKVPSINKNIPTRSGYKFMGWYDSTDYTTGTGYYTSNNESILNYNKTKDITLYAGWSKTTTTVTTYSVTFNSAGGIGGQTSAVTAKKGSPMPTINVTAPTKTGYIFNGWYDSLTGGSMYYTKEGKSAKKT